MTINSRRKGVSSERDVELALQAAGLSTERALGGRSQVHGDILCECGCGTVIPAISKKRRPQRFAHGHNGSQGFRYTESDEGYVTPCWLWDGAIRPDGYGRKNFNGQRLLAHRAMLIARGVELPAHLQVDHLCRVHRCVNPDHLELVDNATNTQRGKVARLSWDAVDAIRAIADEDLSRRREQGKEKRSYGLLGRLAREYDVTVSAISNVVDGRTWVR